jgi:hypothetical protein
MTAPSYDPLKFGAVSFGKTDHEKTNEDPANEDPAIGDPANERPAIADPTTPEDLLFGNANASALQDPSTPSPGPEPEQEDVDDGWGLAPPLPDVDYPEEAQPDSSQSRNLLPTHAAAEDTGRRESAQTTPRPTQSWQQRNRSSHRPARREALPRRQDQPVHDPLQYRRSATGGVVPLLVLLVGLGAAAYLSLVAHNDPMAIFLALVSVVAAPLVRLILQPAVE